MILRRTRRQSHPPPGEVEEPSLINRAVKTQSIKEPSSQINKNTRTLVRAKTLANYERIKIPLNKIPSINSPSFNLVQDLLECKLCNRRLQQPRMLPCQHTFCLKCLHELVNPSSGNVNCPNCGVDVQLDNLGAAGINNLPPNLYLDSFLTALQEDISSSTADQKQAQGCSKCKTIGNTSNCQHCRQAFCAICFTSHTKELQAQTSSLLDQLQDAKERLAHHSEDFKDICEKLKQQINICTEEKIQTLRVEEQGLNNKVSQLQEQGEESCNLLVAKIYSATDLISANADFNSIAENSKKVVLFLKLHKATSEILQEVSCWGENRPIFDEENMKIEVNGNSKRLNSETEENDDVFEDNDKNIGQVTSPDSMSFYYRSRSFIPRVNFGRSVLPKPGGVGVAPWDEGLYLYIAGTDGRQVLVIDRNRMKLVNQLVAPNMLYPQGIAFCKTLHEVYITDKWNHCIHVFTAEGKYLRQLGKRGRTEGSFHSPEGLASGPGPLGTSEQTYLYVCDTGNDRIQVIHPQDGSIVQIIGILDPLPGHKSKRTEFNQPTGIAVSSNSIVIADCGNKRIKTYTLMGEKLSEFGSMGQAKGQFRFPECVAVDKLGFILVGDSGNARVQIFRPNGSLVRTFGGRGLSTGKFSWISGITVTESMDIIVADSKNSSVQIF